MTLITLRATILVGFLILSGQTWAADASLSHRFAARPAGKPATIFLWYSDGTIQPEDGPYCSGLKPPAWRCNFGATLEDCQRQVQTYLDRWYAKFNVVFTFTRPRASDYYTVIITSDAAWCSLNTTEAGVAPFNCNDNPGQTAFAFECGYSAHDCAAIIAHEHAHMVGLDHTSSTRDIMYHSILSTTDGFEDADNAAPDALCTPKQNSYQRMLEQMGPWPGGTKPGPFLDPPDAAVPGQPDASRALDATNSGTPGGTGPAKPQGDGGTHLLPGFDALPPPADDPGTFIPVAPPSRSSGSGCGISPIARPRGWAWALLVGTLLIYRRRMRPRR